MMAKHIPKDYDPTLARIAGNIVSGLVKSVSDMEAVDRAFCMAQEIIMKCKMVYVPPPEVK